MAELTHDLFVLIFIYIVGAWLCFATFVFFIGFLRHFGIIPGTMNE